MHVNVFKSCLRVISANLAFNFRELPFDAHIMYDGLQLRFKTGVY